MNARQPDAVGVTPTAAQEPVQLGYCETDSPHEDKVIGGHAALC